MYSTISRGLTSLVGHAVKLTEATAGQRQMDERLQAAVREVVEAQATAHKYESELEALSGAYTSIEAHAHSLEAQLAAVASNGNMPQPPVQGESRRTLYPCPSPLTPPRHNHSAFTVM
jgi:chromosome segregation ATPase